MIKDICVKFLCHAVTLVTNTFVTIFNTLSPFVFPFV